MKKAVDVFYDQVVAIMPGVVNIGLIESMKVHCYESNIPIRQLADISGGKGITIKPYDPQLCGAIQKAVEAAGHSCYVCNKTVMVNIPKWTNTGDTDRAVAHVGRLEEDTKVIIRNIRKKVRQKLAGSEDEIRKGDKELQTLTDTYVSQVETIARNKIKQLRT